MDPDIFATNIDLSSISTNLNLTLGTNAMAQQLSRGLLDENFLWASCLWGAVAGGYLVYARKQRSIPPFLGGVAMIAASFMISSWFWMSVTCIALMVGVYVLMKQEG